MSRPAQFGAGGVHVHRVWFLQCSYSFQSKIALSTHFRRLTQARASTTAGECCAKSNTGLASFLGQPPAACSSAARAHTHTHILTHRWTRKKKTPSWLLSHGLFESARSLIPKWLSCVGCVGATAVLRRSSVVITSFSQDTGNYSNSCCCTLQHYEYWQNVFFLDSHPILCT